MSVFLEILFRIFGAQRRRRAIARMGDAITNVYEARQKYEEAKAHKASKTGKRYDALLQARQLELHGLHTLREHIEQHGCGV